MKYFIDFEATQFSNEIISVGCVREDGKEFYSLVKSEKPITDFITQLTGITQKEIDEAPNSDEVFSSFYDFISDDEDIHFFCYGNNDVKFVSKNLAKTTSLKATAALSIIGMTMKDYAKKVSSHFGLIKSIGLVKVLAYYKNIEEIYQRHNALEDARFLKEVYDFVTNEKEVVGNPFPEYKDDGTKKKKKKVVQPEDIFKKVECIERYDVNGKLEASHKEIYEAVVWCLANMNASSRNAAKNHTNRIRNKILKSFNNNSTYMNKKWKLKMKEGE